MSNKGRRQGKPKGKRWFSGGGALAEIRGVNVPKGKMKKKKTAGERM